MWAAFSTPAAFGERIEGDRDAHSWTAFFQNIGAPAERVRTLGEAVRDPQPPDEIAQLRAAGVVA